MIDIGIVIMPIKSLAFKMSSGVSDFEMIENRFLEILEQLPNYPFAIIGISDEISELELIELSTSNEVVMDKQREHWDVFISHATEDKDEIARPLAEALTKAGLRVWFDEFSLKVGQSISESINFGLTNSRYGIVIISEHYLRKDWTKRELAGLFAKEQNEKIILPIWHKVSFERLRSYSPILADRLAANSNMGFQRLTQSLLDVISPNHRIDTLDEAFISEMSRPLNSSDNTGKQPIGLWYGRSGYLRLFEGHNQEFQVDGDYDWNGSEWAGHLIGNYSQGLFRFFWWWDKGPERGSGYFAFNPFDHTLKGSWFNKDVDSSFVRNDQMPLPKAFAEWIFDRVEQFSENASIWKE
jgi:hypothetical protein